jgi:crotonobetainyl-CoA:carnitine CoA-transferase CaiB-like acyl-CoA transferase
LEESKGHCFSPNGHQLFRTQYFENHPSRLQTSAHYSKRPSKRRDYTAPLLGEHNLEILCTLGGMSAEEVSSLEAEEAL